MVRPRSRSAHHIDDLGEAWRSCLALWLSQQRIEAVQLGGAKTAQIMSGSRWNCRCAARLGRPLRLFRAGQGERDCITRHKFFDPIQSTAPASSREFERVEPQHHS